MDDFRIFLEFEKEVTCNLIMTDRSLFHERTKILLSQAEDLSYKYICYNNRREVGKDEKNNK